jgi:hypothetical protein
MTGTGVHAGRVLVLIGVLVAEAGYVVNSVVTYEFVTAGNSGYTPENLYLAYERWADTSGFFSGVGVLIAGVGLSLYHAGNLPSTLQSGSGRSTRRGGAFP